MKQVLYYRYLFMLICALITNMKDKIVIKCNSCSKFCKKGITFNLCDEYNFESREKEPCCLKRLEGNRKEYIKKIEKKKLGY